MKKAIFENYSPAVKLLLLLILAIAGLMAFMFVAGVIIKMLWGFDIIGDPSALENLGDPFALDANRLLILFQHLGLFIMPSLVFLQMSTTRSRDFLFWKWPASASKTITTIIILMALMPFINLLVAWNESMKLPAFLSGLEEAMRRMEDAASTLTEYMIVMKSPAQYFYMILLMAVLPAIGEELIFRGIIQRLLTVWAHNYHWGIWLSAFLFSAMHLQFYGFLPRMVLGAAFGYILVYSGNLFYPMIAHFFNNFASLTLAYLSQHGRIDAAIDEVGAASEWGYIIPGLMVSLGLMWHLRKNRDMVSIQRYIDPA